MWSALLYITRGQTTAYNKPFAYAEGTQSNDINIIMGILHCKAMQTSAVHYVKNFRVRLLKVGIGIHLLVCGLNFPLSFKMNN